MAGAAVELVLAQSHVRRALLVGDWAPLLSSLVEAGMPQTEIANCGGVSQAQISRLASGKSRSPSLATIKALCDGLGIPRSSAGLLDRPSEPDTDRREFLGATLATVAATALPPPEDGPADDDLMRSTTAGYRQLEQTVPARMLTEAVMAHLVLLRRLAAQAQGAARTRLLGAVSETAGLAAWLHADLMEPATTRRMYRLAVSSAEQSVHRLLPTYMLGSAGQYATTIGDPTAGVRVIRNAAARLPRTAPPVAWAWLTAIEGVALSYLGDQSALRMLDEAQRHAEMAADVEPLWPWLFRIDAPKIFAYRAVAAGRLGMVDMAFECYGHANGSGRSPKQAAALAAERARVLARAGRLEEAIDVATAALDIGTRHGSERVRHAVREFRANLPPTHLTDDLDERIHASYAP